MKNYVRSYEFYERLVAEEIWNCIEEKWMDNYPLFIYDPEDFEPPSSDSDEEWKEFQDSLTNNEGLCFIVADPDESDNGRWSKARENLERGEEENGALSQVIDILQISPLQLLDMGEVELDREVKEFVWPGAVELYCKQLRECLRNNQAE